MLGLPGMRAGSALTCPGGPDTGVGHGVPINSGVEEMGKGDRKTAKGKRYNASYGNSRSRAVAKVAVGAAAPVVKKTVVKAPAKKAAKAD